MKIVRTALAVTLALSCYSLAGQQKYQILSPDKSIAINVSVSDSIYYNVSFQGKELVKRSGLSMRTSFSEGIKWKVKGAKTSAVNSVLKPLVWQKSSELRDHYNQLHLDFSNGLALEWRVYDNGTGFRWLSQNKGAYVVQEENASFNLGKEGRSWYPQEDDFYSHNERAYRNYRLDSIGGDKLASLPVLFEVKGTKLLLTESDLFNYAGMWVRGNQGGEGGVHAVFPHYPRQKKVTSDRDERVEAREEYIARIQGPQTFPWRIMMIARSDKDILTNQLVYQFARPASGDFSWVKPGKVQWDWWHYNNIYGVDFKAGINNETYKYYIDFASKYHIEYVLLDEGWCDTRDLMNQSPGINVKELADYARSKNVDLILWTSWLVLDKQLDKALDQFAKWGIKGIKVDFMQRDDQDMVNYYEKVARAAAKRKLLVDFHGAYKPTGWIRTYPNVLTSEGVLGNEISKFAASVTPDHTITLPFTRMAAGPMDFTPGGMLNVQKDAWSANPAEPMTLGTRCNQMAMYVIFESPLQMLCDIPTHYYKEPECMEFLAAVPVQWAETVPLEGKIGDYVVMARKAKNGDWYLGAMNDWTARDFSLNLSFLGDGKYKMMIWKDGLNADRNARDFKTETIDVVKGSKIKVSLASGGGYVARLIRVPDNTK